MMPISPISYKPIQPRQQVAKQDANQPVKPLNAKPTVAPRAASVSFGSGIHVADPDSKRFWDIVRGKNTPKHLLDHISQRRVRVGKDGKISFPMPGIDRPRFTYRPNDSEEDAQGDGDGDGQGQGSGKPGGRPQPGQGQGQQGVGSGPGDVGDIIDQDGQGEGEGGKQGGQGAGDYGREQWTLQYAASEIAKLIGREFGLPFLEPKGQGSLSEISTTWNSKKSPPPGKIIIPDTVRPAIAREILDAEMEGREIDLDRLNITKPDIRRIDWKEKRHPLSKAVIFYIMDVSGSISEVDKEMARTNNFFLSTWIKYCYGLKAAQSMKKSYNDKDFFGKGVDERYVIHTDDAKEVSEDEFYTTRQSGGTTISSSLKLVQKIIEEKYSTQEWNVYIFQYSDGESFGDNDESGKVMKELLQKGVRLYGYSHLGSYYSGYGGSSNYKDYIKREFEGNPHVRIATLDKPELGTYQKAIKTLLEDPKKAQGGK